jgi:hypothetical protein
MSRVELLDNKDMPLWDSYVSTSKYGLVYHLSCWKELLEQSFEHIKGYFFAIRDTADNRIVGGVPVYWVKSRILGSRLVSIPYSTICDPLISNDFDMNLIVNEAAGKFTETKTKYLEIRTCFNNALLSNSTPGRIDNYFHHFLNLDAGLQEIFNSFHVKSIKTPIKIALKNCLELKQGVDDGDIEKFYHLYFDTRKRLGLPPMPLRFFDRMWHLLRPKGLMSLLFALFEGRPIAGMIITKFNGVVTAEYMEDSIKYRMLCPNHFLYWESIKMACNEGYRMFSFGRTHERNKGLMNFKNHWGTNIVPTQALSYLETSGSRKSDREASWLYYLIRSVSTKMPDFLFRAIGDIFYRHLG